MRALFERLKASERPRDSLMGRGSEERGGGALGSCFIPFLEGDGGLNLLEKVVNGKEKGRGRGGGSFSFHTFLSSLLPHTQRRLQIALYSPNTYLRYIYTLNK